MTLRPMHQTNLTRLQQRAEELRAVRQLLRPDQDDARVLSELTVVQQQLSAVEREIAAFVQPNAALR